VLWLRLTPPAKEVAVDNSPIIVGFDGSAGARAALRWAMDDAMLRKSPVRLVYAIEAPVAADAVFPVDLVYTAEGHRRRAQELLDGAAQTRPEVLVTTDLVDGPAVSVLCEVSHDAQLMVLGSRGHGGFSGLLVGSVSVAVSAHAAGPVVVVRDGDAASERDRPVVVGVDDSAEAQAAVAFAAEESALRGVELVAVRAWNPPPVPWRSDVRPLIADAAELETAERHLLNDAVAGWSAKYPQTPVTTRLVAGDARRALVEASANAQLVVVGSRGRGGFAGLVLGSVSQHLLHHAHCTVAVARPRALRDG
jgi:nucleotide-binding universal stress UspA family protein